MKTKIILISLTITLGIVILAMKMVHLPGQKQPGLPDSKLVVALNPNSNMPVSVEPPVVAADSLRNNSISTIVPSTNAPIATAPDVAVPDKASQPIRWGESQPNTTLAKSHKKFKPPLQDPYARTALSLVGADLTAELYWFGAINDPSLPPTERQDLIEDLNEVGLSDPKHPKPEELPLIVNRLKLIEALAPYAIDHVNAAAFAEAYKDLINLLDGRWPQ